MAACIARVSLTVVPDTNVLIIARWGVRELAVGVVAVNTAMLRPSKQTTDAYSPLVLDLAHMS